LLQGSYIRGINLKVAHKVVSKIMGIGDLRITKHNEWARRLCAFLYYKYTFPTATAAAAATTTTTTTTTTTKKWQQ
jgi:hypothetical protein